MRSPKSFHVFLPFFVLLTISFFSHAPEVPAQQTAAPPIAVTPVAPAAPSQPSQAAQTAAPPVAVAPAAPGVPSQPSQTVGQGSVSSQQVQEALRAVEKGQISPETIKQFEQKFGLGTLTTQEIEAGKKLLEQKGQEVPKTVLPEQPKAPEQKADQKAVAEPVKEEQKPKTVPVQEDEYFRKNAAPETPSLEIFGQRLFSGAPSTFAPITSVPVSNDYLIGPGDEIRVLMWGRLDGYYSLEVDNEGVINFPKVGPMTVAGLTFAEVKELIRVKAEAITGVNVNVSMGKLRTIQVFVLGEVRSPGVYTVSSLATVTNALLASGGPTHLGSLRKVDLKRQGKKITTIDLYDFLMKGDTSADTRLMPGDTIFIPQCGSMVSVSGNVKRPAIYEMAEERTLQGALSLAGGLKAQAYNQRIQIERAFQNRTQIILDISHEELAQKKPVPLQDGDLIRIFSILPTSVNAVYLYGNVLRPGEYAFAPGLRVQDIIQDIQSLGIDTYYDYSLIKRYHQEKARAELIPFNLGKLLISKDLSQNISLHPLDEIYVFNKGMFEDKEFAEISGEVRKPGRFFIEEMKVKDLILRAGDLKKDAYLQKGEIIRYDKHRNRQTLYFKVAAAMADDPQHNLKVQHEDQVVIHSVWEEKWREYSSIKGEVKNPGEYPLTDGMRLKDLIFKAGQFTRDTYLDLGHLYRTDWRTKEVTIQTFDVAKAIEGDPQNNLALKDLDQVIIHSTWEYIDKYVVHIRGKVNNPGDYPYATNMTVKDLIQVSGNVMEAAYLERAELVRSNIIEGKKVETSLITFDIRKALANDPAHNVKLKPFDVVNVKEIPDWKEKRLATISGEVLFPGIYQLRKEERLSSLIERAGGFTDKAYLRGAFFTRESIKKVQQERLNEMIKGLEIEIAQYSSAEAQGSLSKEDAAAQAQFLAAEKNLIAKMREAKPTGRVVISMVPTSVMKDASLDMVLEEGDTLHVPKSPGTVNVLGSVYNPSALIFEASRSELSYYLKKTGGPTENAEDSQMYLVRADGTVVSKKAASWWGMGWSDEEKRWQFMADFEDTQLYPGDTVLVPQKVIKPSFMKDVKDITTILFQLAVGAGVAIAAL
jgi:polysaccharide biosynthesis/export protein